MTRRPRRPSTRPHRPPRRSSDSRTRVNPRESIEEFVATRKITPGFLGLGEPVEPAQLAVLPINPLLAHWYVQAQVVSERFPDLYGGSNRPKFGIYDQYLGPIGTEKANTSARILSELLAARDMGQPMFGWSQLRHKGIAIAIILAGPDNDPDGLMLSGSPHLPGLAPGIIKRNHPIFSTLLAMVKLGEHENQLITQVVFLLPQSTSTRIKRAKKNPRETDVTGQLSFQKEMLALGLDWRKFAEAAGLPRKSHDLDITLSAHEIPAFYGQEGSSARSWPGKALSALQMFERTGSALSSSDLDTIDGLTFEDARSADQMAGMEGMKERNRQDREWRSFLMPRKAPSESVKPQVLQFPAQSRAQIDFVDDPEAERYAPVSVKIGGKSVFKDEKAYARHQEAKKDEKVAKKMLPSVMAFATIYSKKLLVGLARSQGGDTKVEIEKILKAGWLLGKDQVFVLSAERESYDGTWFSEWMMPPRHHLIEVAQRLLRVVPARKSRTSGLLCLQFIPFNEPPPYLFDGFYENLATFFRTSGKSRLERGGEASYLSGQKGRYTRAMTAGSERVSREFTSAPALSPAKMSGIYVAASAALRKLHAHMQSLGKDEKKEQIDLWMVKGASFSEKEEGEAELLDAMFKAGVIEEVPKDETQWDVALSGFDAFLNAGGGPASDLPDDFLRPLKPENSEWSEDIEQIRATLNPRRRQRRQRKPRRTRGSGRSKTRRNPFEREDVDRLIGYADRPAGREDEARKVFEVQPQIGDISEAVRDMFPRRELLLKDYTASNQLRKLEKYDIIARLTRPGGSDPVIEEDLSEWSTDKEEGAETYLRERAQLSLDDATSIIAAQREGKKRGTTISASMAVCKPYKVKRLISYRPPAAVLDRNACFIWVSPPTDQTMASAPGRVMMFRRGDHIDCDMTVRGGASMGLLIGKAIQSTVLWLAEKKGKNDSSKRADKMTVYIGQVGSRYFKKLWEPALLQSPKIPLNAATLSRNASQAPKEEHISKEEASTDLQRYLAAVSTMRRVPLAYAPEPQYTETRHIEAEDQEQEGVSTASAFLTTAAPFDPFMSDVPPEETTKERKPRSPRKGGTAKTKVSDASVGVEIIEQMGSPEPADVPAAVGKKNPRVADDNPWLKWRWS